MSLSGRIESDDYVSEFSEQDIIENIIRKFLNIEQIADHVISTPLHRACDLCMASADIDAGDIPSGRHPLPTPNKREGAVSNTPRQKKRSSMEPFGPPTVSLSLQRS